MAMTLSACNLDKPTMDQVNACLNDCKTNFRQQYDSTITSMFNLHGQKEGTKLNAHVQCNEWRKQAEVLEAASEPSNVILIATVSIIIAIAAAKFFASRQEATATNPNSLSQKKITK
jgi:DNA uptake protein ComE-like DNA-binding protein